MLFLIFHELPETCSPHFKETYMFLKDYQSIRDEYLPDYYKEATWNLLHTYIDEHSQRFIYECPGYGVQAISRLKYQCANMTFSEKSV